MNIKKYTSTVLLTFCCCFCLCFNMVAQNNSGNAYGWGNGNGNGNAYGWGNGNGNGYAYGWGNGNGNGYAFGWQNNIDLESDAENRLIGEENEQIAENIEINHICFPDTVSIGETVVLCGYIVNKGEEDFHNGLYVQYNVEDEMEESFTTDEKTGMAGSEEVVIPAQDSLAFDITVEVTEENFRVNSYDVVVVWPIGPNLTVDDPKHTETFVKTASAGKNANNIATDSSYELYPNPANNYVSVKALNRENTAIQKVEMFNTVGQRILEQKYDNSMSYVNIVLPNHTLAGMYYLHIIDVNNRTFVEQLIVH